VLQVSRDEQQLSGQRLLLCAARLLDFLCCIVFKLGTLTEQSSVQAAMSDEQYRDFSIPSTTPSIILSACVLGALVVSSVILVAQLAMARARMRREAAAKLPTCEWQLAEGQQYIAFLSHYKVEAGAQVISPPVPSPAPLPLPTYVDVLVQSAKSASLILACSLTHLVFAQARWYLKDGLDQMLRSCPCYLEYRRRELHSACRYHSSFAFVCLCRQLKYARRLAQAIRGGRAQVRGARAAAVGGAPHAAMVLARDQ
jgi:hypothetical protein